MEVRRRGPKVKIVSDPKKSAEIVGLRYVSDQSPGIQRIKKNQKFLYLDACGKAVCQPQILQRIKSLAIPPAWTDVWICPADNGHLQATGRDDRGRKQYRYHPRWRDVRDETKYTRMILLGKVLPKIRQRLKRDLGLPGLPRRKVLATVVRL